MSQRVEATITCPVCGHHFPFTLYRSIWGEYPENRELVMTDKINVATCPSCRRSTKLPYPFIYTNANLKFAVWWEPEYDPTIDSDAQGFNQMLGAGNYLATAPRVKNWMDFKETILKFERGELKGTVGAKSRVMEKEVQGFIKQIQNHDRQKKRSGCFGSVILILFFILALTIGLTSCESEQERAARLQREEQQRIELAERQKEQARVKAEQEEKEQIAKEAKLEKERQEKEIYDRYINN